MHNPRTAIIIADAWECFDVLIFILVAMAAKLSQASYRSYLLH